MLVANRWLIALGFVLLCGCVPDVEFPSVSSPDGGTANDDVGGGGTGIGAQDSTKEPDTTDPLDTSTDDVPPPDTADTMDPPTDIPMDTSMEDMMADVMPDTVDMVLGNTCTSPKTVDQLPYFEAFGTDDFGITNKVTTSGECTLPQVESAGADVVYELTPESSGTFSISLFTSFDATLSVMTDCAIPACVAGAMGNGPDATLMVGLTGGQTYYIVVDSAVEEAFGSYDISIWNVTDPPQDGDSCEVPIELEAGFATVNGSTSDFTNMHEIFDGDCVGNLIGAVGGLSPEVVYTIVPTQTKTLKLTADTSFFGSFFLTSTCPDVGIGCLAYRDGFGELSITAVLEAGTQYYLVLDGATVPSDAGTYDLTICQPVCDGATCLADGCGGTCPCAAGAYCGVDSACWSGGDSCADAIELSVGQPVQIDTSGYTNSFDQTCGGGGAQQLGIPDTVFHFVAPFTGLFEVWLHNMVSASPKLVTILDSCQNSPGACITSQDYLGIPDPLAFGTVVGEEFFIVVDGFDMNEIGPVTVEILPAADGLP